MTSSPGTPEEVRPLTQEEVAIQTAYGVVTILRDAQCQADTAWASLPGGLRRAPGVMTAATLARVAADALLWDLDGFTEKMIAASTESVPESEMLPWWEALGRRLAEGEYAGCEIETVTAQRNEVMFGGRAGPGKGPWFTIARADSDGMVSVLAAGSGGPSDD